MTPAQFDLVARLIRSSGSSKKAARLVLVDGIAPSSAAVQTGVSKQAVSNTTGRIRRAHEAILDAYDRERGFFLGEKWTDEEIARFRASEPIRFNEIKEMKR